MNRSRQWAAATAVSLGLGWTARGEEPASSPMPALPPITVTPGGLPLAVPMAPTLAAPVEGCPPAGCLSHGPKTRYAFFAELCRRPPVPPPNGAVVHQWYEAQIERAELQKSFIQLHEWYQGGKTLGPAGRRHLDRLARTLLNGPGQIFLEPDNDDKLTAARRVELVQQLMRYGLADAEARVAVAYPLGEGLYGDEAVRIYPRLFLFRNAGGGGVGGGGGGGGLGGIGGGLGGFGGGVSSFQGY